MRYQARVSIRLWLPKTKWGMRLVPSSAVQGLIWSHLYLLGEAREFLAYHLYERLVNPEVHTDVRF